ncbi:MAG: preprotein translocase subunit YajC [Parvibaculales bacterium]
MFISPAFAQTATAAGGPSLLSSLLPFLIIFAIIYFLIIRPQNKRQKEHAAMLDALRLGDKVITQGGIVGKVAKVDETEVQIDIAENTRVTVIKSTILSVQNKSEPAD